MGRTYLHILLASLVVPLLGLAPVGQAVAQESEYCLGCHSEEEAVGNDLLIDSQRFDTTAHGELGCASCHSNIPDTHPDDGLAPFPKAECRECHQEVSEEYARTEHAANATCGDCHNPHQVRGAHQVSGHDMNRQCSSCHLPAEMSKAHGLWLPQADLHLEMLPCISCHSGSKDYVINLFITARKFHPDSAVPVRGQPFDLAEFADLQALAVDGDIPTLIDTDRDGKVSLAELRRFNGSSEFPHLRLKGMFTPAEVTHDLQILNNRWDCTFCHASGPDAMQTTFLSLPQADGSYRRIPVEKGAILDILNGTPDFYMMGATRNAAMNKIGLAILAGGLVMPLGHGTIRLLTRKNRR
ncbi:MAG: cytochrome C [Desulfuromonadales bacterium]|nr:cytochrome C [Desulfuromonadales bacterium]